MRKLFFLGALLLWVMPNLLVGQDPHFSQFYASPLLLNPALAGDHKGPVRAALVNRRQWNQLGKPIQTTGASVDSKIWLNGDYIGIGALFINDKAGQVGYVTNSLFISSSYLKQIGTNTLSAGIQLGMSDTGIDPSQTFPSQFNSATGVFDLGSNNETSLDFNRKQLDINLGVMWHSVIGGRYQMKTGFSVAHLNRPNEALSDQRVVTPLRFAIHHRSHYLLDASWSLISESQVMYTATAKQFGTVFHVKRQFNEEVAMFAGLGYRGYGISNEGAIIVTGLTYGLFDLGVSYDWNISPLSRESTQKTSLEFTVIINTPEPRRKRTVIYKKNKPCPVFVKPVKTPTRKKS
ncbi:MAG: PorP/SprF family type IX secretion system membrane protein [Cytophagales bacterium]|nr:PorP/SprF family type IX secretion system membrane protein [Cytophagales bacterium]